jgi:chromosome partitioning protein
VPKIHLFANRKGGVGKTTLCVNLAAATHHTLTGGKDAIVEPTDDDQPAVLAVSIDPQGSAVYWGDRIEGAGNKLPFDYAQIDTPDALRKLRDLPYAHVFIDSAGSFDNAPLLRAALDVADDVVIPMSPTALAVEPTEDTVNAVKGRGIPFRVVLNDWDPRDGKAEVRQFAKYVQGKGWPLCKTVVRHYKIHERGALDGITILDYPQSRIEREARADMTGLALELGFGGEIAITGKDN